jgi:hypothetical protein
MNFKYLLTLIPALLLITSVDATEIPGSNGVPDLTKGGELKRINERWVGPLGIYCGTWRPRGQKMEDVRQLLVNKIDEGSPADGVLKLGDVILGADGTGAKEVPLFEGAAWAMIPIANAITEAEARNPAILKLLIWRPTPKEEQSAASVKQPNPKKKDGDAQSNAAKSTGHTMTVSITLETLGRYSDTAPYDCPKSKIILRKGIKALYEANNPGKAGFDLLCLLAADDPTDSDNEKYQERAREWAHNMILSPEEKDEKGPGAWHSGAQLIALSEYYMKTEDQAVFSTLVKLAERHARGVSWFGTTGHRFAELQPDGSFSGRIAGYGPINCSGALGFLGLSLARKAGVDSPVVENAINRQAAFFGHFAFRGGPGYGEHAYALAGGLGDINGKSAMPALAFGMLKGKEDKARFFSAAAATSTFAQRQYAHGGSYFGQVMHPLGAAQGGKKAAHLLFNEIRWHLDLKRRWDHSRIYDSSGNSYGDFGPPATALILYALPLKQLYMTGRGQTQTLQFSDKEFDELVADKMFIASDKTTEELLEALSSVRRRGDAAAELADRMKANPDLEEWPAVFDQLIARASDPKAGPTARSGACKALQLSKDRNSTATMQMKNAEIVEAMAGLLKDQDAFMRFGGVRVLEKFTPEEVRPYANEIMDAIIAIDRPTFPLDQEDPVQWSHGQMGALLVNKVLKNGMEGLDRGKILSVLRSLLKTPDGGARNVITQALKNLTMDEILQLADSIVDTIKYPSPANSMFDGAAENCQNVLAEYHFEEALPLSVEYNPHSLAKTGILKKFGPSALTTQSARDLMVAIGDLILIEAVEGGDKLPDQILKGTSPETLNKLKRIHSVNAAKTELTLPDAKTELMVEATNYALPDAGETTYTWRKVYGAGKVSFTPNASALSKATRVVFTDQKPGKYRFEVTMSDTLGFNTISETLDIILYDKKGKLPANKPPQANSQTYAAVPGRPMRIMLSGVDPDGDELGYVVTRQPEHGRLSGVGGNLIYTADFGHDGTDSFMFQVLDGQGESAAGTVSFKVSDKNVGVAIYEGFDYPAGTVIDHSGGASFGFDGPWEKSDGKEGGKNFWVDRGALDAPDKKASFTYASLPATGGKLTKGEAHRSCIRFLDPSILAAHKLLDPGQDLWFSLFVGGKGNMSFKFLGATEGPDFGFKIGGYKIETILSDEVIGECRNPWSRNQQSRFSEDSPNMIIGRCIWGKTDKDPDVVAIYRVFDAPELGPLILKKPVCLVREIIDQEKIRSIQLYFRSDGPIDEIRIGSTLHSVLVGTRPLTAR